MDAISAFLGLFWAVGPFFGFGAWYSIPAFFVERYRLKRGKKPCRNLWPLVLIGFLAIAGCFVLAALKPDTADLALAGFLVSCTFASILLWIAVGVSLAKKYYHSKS